MPSQEPPDERGEGGSGIEIKLLELIPNYAELPFVTPLKIGSGLIDSATFLTVTARVRTRDGREGTGQGAILLSHVWAWPGPEPAAQKDSAMRQSAEDRIRRLLADGGWRTPLGWYSDLPTDPAHGVPALAAAVAASPADAAIHDALGKAVGASSYDLLPAFMRQHLLAGRQSSVPIMHTVGLSDLSESLQGPLQREGIRGLKVKLGGDPQTDAARTTEIFQYASRLTRGLYLSVDGNESYPGPEAVTEYLSRLPAPVLAALRFVEQPVPRTSTQNMSGPVLKTCKGHSAVLLALSRLAGEGRPYAIADLTNPGIALLHSLGLAARCSPIAGLEANARQYLPAYHPSGLPVCGGALSTALLTPVGLGY